MNYYQNERIIAFDKGIPGPEDEFSAEFIEVADTPTKIVFYEWDKANKLWTKTKVDDPEPNQDQLPNGLFDGQIIEVEISAP